MDHHDHFLVTYHPRSTPSPAPLHIRRLPAGLFVAAVLLSASAARAQQMGLPLDRVLELAETRSIARNSVANLHAEGDSLWVGPELNLSFDAGASWYQATADSVANGRGRVFSLDVEGGRIAVGLGFSQEVVADGSKQFVPTAAGFVFSEDGGRSWTYGPPPLDAPGDTLIEYGVSTLRALDVIVPEQSPPYDIDLDPATGTIWTAGWASGIRRSDDGGLTWQRVVLPPDSLSQLHPDRTYDFVYSPRQTEGSQNLNFAAFAVLVDEEGTVWAGTAGGLNRSGDGLTWRRYSATDLSSPLKGNWIISIEEQPLEGRNPIWFSTWRAEAPSERYGVMVTRDGGESFESFLSGEQVYDFAFDGETVYVAGDSGLFITEDGGTTWRTINRFDDMMEPDRSLRAGVRAFSVARAGDALWVGTEDGLVRSLDGGETWRVFRTEVPLAPETETGETPRVDTYAYPNPFSPISDGVVRFRYRNESDGPVTVRIFDFAMQPVRLLTDGARAPGEREERWNGLDDSGRRLPNGTYFYAIETEGGTTWGKLILIQ